jgi:hypothetical protein
MKQLQNGPLKYQGVLISRLLGAANGFCTSNPCGSCLLANLPWPESATDQQRSAESANSNCKGYYQRLADVFDVIERLGYEGTELRATPPPAPSI